MAVMYSKLGGCFGEMTKLGPLARTHLCGFVKGLLDRLMNHFALDSSIEEESGGNVSAYEEGKPLFPGG